MILRTRSKWPQNAQKFCAISAQNAFVVVLHAFFALRFLGLRGVNNEI